MASADRYDQQLGVEPRAARDLISIVYHDATRQTVTTFADGRTQDRGLQPLRRPRQRGRGPNRRRLDPYTYDADGHERVKESGGVKTYCFYDDAGRKIGYVDGDGSVTEYVYNHADQLIKTIRYATRLVERHDDVAVGHWLEHDVLRRPCALTPTRRRAATR